MYTNLDTTTGLQALRQLFQTYNNLIPASFPRVFFLTSLEIVMKNNIYTFGDTSWWQLQGTAVGTPAAPLYSILTISTNFLDLQINIMNNNIQTSIYQKELNLYLCIPPTSAHPTSCFKGLVTGRSSDTGHKTHLQRTSSG
jgi:hypothetical protein